MMTLASTVVTEPWDKNFPSAILRTIESQILPEVTAIEDQLHTSYEKMFGSTIGQLGSGLAKIVAPAIPTITMATYFGLSTSQVVALGASAAAAGIGIVLPELMKHWQERRASNRNGLGFLLKFRDDQVER
jgi:hypothetical protein